MVGNPGGSDEAKQNQVPLPHLGSTAFYWVQTRLVFYCRLLPSDSACVLQGSNSCVLQGSNSCVLQTVQTTHQVPGGGTQKICVGRNHHHLREHTYGCPPRSTNIIGVKNYKRAPPPPNRGAESE